VVISPPQLRIAVRLACTIVCLAAGAAVQAAVPGAFDGAEAPLVALVIAHVSRATFELTKYGRVTAYRLWSARALGVLLALSFAHSLVTGEANPLLGIALWIGVLSEIEGFSISAILPAWRAGVPSLLHGLDAWRREPRPR
jgi:hypothetical protein